MDPRFKDALLAYITSTLSDPAGVDEVAMLSLYKLRGEAADVEFRHEVDALIRRVALRGGRYHLDVPGRMSEA